MRAAGVHAKDSSSIVFGGWKHFSLLHTLQLLILGLHLLRQLAAFVTQFLCVLLNLLLLSFFR